jgi:hypothetical protein
MKQVCFRFRESLFVIIFLCVHEPYQVVRVVQVTKFINVRHGDSLRLACLFLWMNRYPETATTAPMTAITTPAQCMEMKKKL